MKRLIRGLGARFFKFDYNTIPGAGTEVDSESIGEGLQGHCLAYLDWLEDVRRAYPDVTIWRTADPARCEPITRCCRGWICSRPADQCNPAIYAAIAAAAGLSILPEQQGNWGYAQQEMPDETAVVFAPGRRVCGGLLFLRIHRSDGRRTAGVGCRCRACASCGACGTADRWCRSGRWDCRTSKRVGRPASTERSERVICGMSDGRRRNENRVQGYLTLWRREGSPSVDVAIPRDVSAETGLSRSRPSPTRRECPPMAHGARGRRHNPSDSKRLNRTFRARLRHVSALTYLAEAACPDVSMRIPFATGKESYPNVYRYSTYTVTSLWRINPRLHRTRGRFP